jgi:murein DD-endopeptidase / murein LD-carboxypeptidase
MNRRGSLRPAFVYIGCAIAFFSLGCMEPSVRYIRDPQGGVRMLVPANWDYRTNYQVPVTRLKKIADSYLGTRYKSGGMSRAGLDCSGFVCLVFKELNQARLPRSSGQQWKLGRGVSIADARAGDFVFFRGGLFGMVNHVGIYMGDNSFIHASKSSGVIYSTLDDDYYKKHFAGIRRVF